MHEPLVLEDHEDLRDGDPGLRADKDHCERLGDRRGRPSLDEPPAPEVVEGALGEAVALEPGVVLRHQAEDVGDCLWGRVEDGACLGR